jgi:hypothetical protein
MRDVPHIEPSSYINTEQALRFLARDARNPCTAIVYWLGATEPSRESSFFEEPHANANRFDAFRLNRSASALSRSVVEMVGRATS